MNNKKYIVGLVGLAAGFAISFLWTQSINKTAAGTAAGPHPAGAQGSAGGSQGAMMGQVQQIIEKAKQNTKDFDAQIDVAKVYDQIGRAAETVEYLKKAYDLDPKKSAQLGIPAYIGGDYFDQKQYPEAEQWVGRAVEGDPNQPEVYIELGVTFIQRQPPDPDRAVQEIQRALKIDPKNAHALGHLVEAYALKKDAGSAEDALNRLKAAEPSNQRISGLQSLVA